MGFVVQHVLSCPFIYQNILTQLGFFWTCLSLLPLLPWQSSGCSRMFIKIESYNMVAKSQASQHNWKKNRMQLSRAICRDQGFSCRLCFGAYVTDFEFSHASLAQCHYVKIREFCRPEVQNIVCPWPVPLDQLQPLAPSSPVRQDQDQPSVAATGSDDCVVG